MAEAPENGMAHMAQAMADMTAAFAAQTAAKAQRDLQKQQREEAAAEARVMTEFRRHNPPEFKGEIDPEKADLWMQGMERIFGAIRCSEESKVVYATYQLRGDAEYWWKSAKRIAEAAQEVITWDVFQRKFLERYFPQSARTKLGDDFLKLRQGNMSIGEYAAKFESLSRYFKFFRDGVDDSYMCHRFQEGLRYDIQDSVMPLGIQQFHPLVEKCRDIEAMKNRRMNRGTNSNSGGPIRSNHQNQGRGGQGKKPYQRPQGSTRGQGSKGFCYRCGDPSHYADKCTEKGDLCFNCHKPGHFSRDCKAPKTETTTRAAKDARPTAPGRVYTMDGKEASRPNESFQGECEIADDDPNTLSLDDSHCGDLD